MTRQAVLVLTTCADAASAARLADSIVGQRLAACVNAIGGVESTYHWNGKVERGAETLLLIKTTQDRYEAIESHIRAHSGYELPEIVAVPLESGYAPYLDWIRRETESTED